MAFVLKRLPLPNLFSCKLVAPSSIRYASKIIKTLKKKKPKVEKRPPKYPIESMTSSLSARGYLRSFNLYNPPANLKEDLAKIFKELNISSGTAQIADKTEKFNILSRCSEVFQHAVPNSMLHEIESVNDIIKFYETPIDPRIPLDALKAIDLPPNVHIQYDYHRFDPNTDTMFNGISAFPKSSTIVTGVKNREKYSGYKAKKSWP